MGHQTAASHWISHSERQINSPEMLNSLVPLYLLAHCSPSNPNVWGSMWRTWVGSSPTPIRMCGRFISTNPSSASLKTYSWNEDIIEKERRYGTKSEEDGRPADCGLTRRNSRRSKWRTRRMRHKTTDNNIRINIPRTMCFQLCNLNTFSVVIPFVMCQVG